MKKILSVILALTMLSGITAFAETTGSGTYVYEDSGGEKLSKFTYDIVDGQAEITAVYAYGDKIIFPAEIKDYPVKLQWTEILSDRTKISSIIFEDGIEEINYECTGYDNLAEIKLPQTLKTGNINFMGAAIESIRIPGSYKEISSMFAGHCPNLKEVIIEDGVEVIGKNAFYICPSLTEISIPDSVHTIGERAFANCTGLKDINIGEGVETIGKYAFVRCSGLTDVVIPDSVTIIDDSAFLECTNLTNVILSKNLLSIRDGAFQDSGIKEINLPDSLELIGERCFMRTPLKEIKIPKRVDNIGYHAFFCCKSLKKINIPKSAIDNVYEAWYGCDALDDMTYEGEMTANLYNSLNTTPWIEKYHDTVKGDFVIIDGCLVRYKGSDKNPVIPDEVTSLGNNAFTRTEIDTVKLSPNIKVIPKKAFMFSKIREVTIPSTVKTVEEWAFGMCYWLRVVNIESGVQVNGEAFLSCYYISPEDSRIDKGAKVNSSSFKQTPLDKEWVEGGSEVYVSGVDVVTEQDVKSAKAKHSLAEDGGDYTKFMERADEASKDNVSHEDAYKMYFFSNEISEYGSNGKSFSTSSLVFADPETTQLSSLMRTSDDKYYDFRRRYLYKDKTNPYENGTIIIDSDGFSAEAVSGAAQADTELFFLTDSDIAKVINKYTLGRPEDIRYVGIGPHKIGIDIPINGDAIYVRTSMGEFMITSIVYTDDTLSSCLVLDSSEYILCEQGKKSAGLDKAYKTLQVKQAPSFTDTAGDKAVSLLTRLGIISGYEDGTFRGDKNVTRAEAARMIAVMSADTDTYFNGYLYNYDDYYDIDIFTDVPDSHWAKKYILHGYNEGYISGVKKSGQQPVKDCPALYETAWNGERVRKTDAEYLDTYDFCPDDTVTEQQMAKMLVSVIDKFGDTMASAEGGWPDGYVSVAKRLGICENASDKPATRLTAARMIKNALDAYVTNSAEPEEVYDIAGNLYNRPEAEPGMTVTETTFSKGIFYNLHWRQRRAKIHGTVTATHDTDSSLRDNEIKFTIGETHDCYIKKFRARKTVTLLTGYDDIAEYNGKECDIYIELVNGNPVAVIAE